VTTLRNPVERARARAGHAIFSKVAGPGGFDARDRIHLTPGPRWFPAGSPIRRVHGDASNYVGGLRALLLQSLHPLAMAGVAGHSGYRGDPWGRLSRTATFIACTTFGTAADAQEMVDRVKAVHERVRGKTAEGVPYRASDPHLLRWVHIAEADSFLASYQRYGAHHLTAAEADEYVAQTGRVAIALGATEVPTTTGELAEAFDDFSSELRATPEALDTAHFLLREPPLPWFVRPAYHLLASGSVALLPHWARAELDLDGATVRAIGDRGGALATRAVRWGLGGSKRSRNPTT
jgi:uncharacterized protein (DUF2236 family)